MDAAPPDAAPPEDIPSIYSFIRGGRVEIIAPDIVPSAKSEKIPSYLASLSYKERRHEEAALKSHLDGIGYVLSEREASCFKCLTPDELKSSTIDICRKIREELYPDNYPSAPYGCRSKRAVIIQPEYKLTSPPEEKFPNSDEQAEIREWSLLPELTISILVRLPPLDLICYQVVCKSWFSAISSLISWPYSISEHWRHSKSDPSRHFLLFHEDCPQPFGFNPRGPFTSVMYCLAPSVAIVGSVNGLICIVANSPGPKMSGDDIWIVNPFTRYIRKLPLPLKFPFQYYTDTDTDTDTVGFVFWWDSITGDDGDAGKYKLARIISKPKYNIVVASVWESTSPEEWCDIRVGFDGSFCRPSKILSGCDIVVGDFAYWVVFNVIDALRIGELFVLSLNLKTLSLSRNPIPFPLHYMSPQSLVDHLLLGNNYYLFAGNWVGNFALIEKEANANMFDVWTMDEGVGWSKKRSFCLDFPILRCLNDVNGKVVIMRLIGASIYGIILYDIGTGETELIEDFKSGQLVSSAHDFVGSFESIEGFIPLETTDDLSSLLRVVWPYPSSRMSENYDMKMRATE